MLASPYKYIYNLPCLYLFHSGVNTMNIRHSLFRLTALMIMLCATTTAGATSEKAQRLAQQAIIVDGHIDVPYRLHEHWDDVTEHTKTGDFDLPRAKAGGLNAPFMSIYVPSSLDNSARSTATAHRLIDMVEAMVARAPNQFAIARSVDDVRKQFKKGLVSLPLGMENGSPVQGDFANLRHFYQRGIRYITLAHAKSNTIADSSYDDVRKWNGLSDFGKQMVGEMNRLGIMVDISHVSDQAFYQVLEITRAPVIASHSSLRHFTPGFERNMSDDMVKALGKNGGVIMINFGSTFVSQTSREWVDQYRTASAKIATQHGQDSAELKQFQTDYKNTNPFPFASLDTVLDHIDRAVQLAGIDHVGLGSDFDGVGNTLPEGLKTVADYPKLVEGLIGRGYSDSDIRKILGENLLRVWSEVETIAQHSANALPAGYDSHSFANPDQVKVTHIDLDLTASFDKSVLSGTATLHFERIQPNADTLVVDTRDLNIESVTSNGDKLTYTLDAPDTNLGSALRIRLPKAAQHVTVHYQTSPSASGLQWLTPEQTAGKKQPFLFTQAQAIHARSFIPLQDSPQVRITYKANIHTPKALRAVMSAANDPSAPLNGHFTFDMPQAVPSYLIALAIGDLAFQPMGERTGVYAEPSWLAASAAEFEDTEAMLEATEKRYGPYRWDRYDLLILPPSFPFGGMENPRLSFITPTVIAGDKSLVSLIAHELAHSWSGNTVSNAAWRDLWLNEGFTTYLTYRIMEMIYGEDRYNMEAVLGYQELQGTLARKAPKDTILAIDMTGRDPDEVFSNIPYEKGALFLRELEQRVGRKNFDRFLMRYFEEFAFQSITTDNFVDYLNTTLLKKYPHELDAKRIQQWIFEPGLPEGVTVPHSDAFAKVDRSRQQWLDGDISADTINTGDWTVHHWLYFLNNMPEKLSQQQMIDLDRAFKLTNSKNNEIAHSWFMMAINNQYEPTYRALHSYLVRIGRNKLVAPLYKALSKTPAGKTLAQKAFKEAKPGYHPLTIKINEPVVMGE